MTFKDIIKEAKEITFGVKLWAAEKFEPCLPDQVRRMVLIELQQRVMKENPAKEYWEVTFRDMLKKLKD